MTSNIPSKFPTVPAPWTLKADGYWFILSVLGKTSETLSSGNFDPLEVQSKELAEEPGSWKGGVSMVMILRYHESPVGPYDELLITAGAFSTPPGGPSPDALRITRIYVSTLASVANGRENWNIPKHLAKFEFTPSGEELGVRVYPTMNDTGDVSTFSSAPCFAAAFTPWSLPLPAIPYSASLMPFDTHLVQPPLEQSPNVEEDGLVGTNNWKRMLPGFKGKIKGASWKGLLPGGKLGDGVHFPDIQPWRMAIQWTECTVDFPVSEIL